MMRMTEKNGLFIFKLRN